MDPSRQLPYASKSSRESTERSQPPRATGSGRDDHCVCGQSSGSILPEHRRALGCLVESSIGSREGILDVDGDALGKELIVPKSSWPHKSSWFHKPSCQREA